MTSCCLLTFEYKLDFYNTWHWVILWDRVGNLLIFWSEGDWLFFFFWPLPRGMWDIVPWPGIKTVPLELEPWSLNLWTTWLACLWVLRLFNLHFPSPTEINKLAIIISSNPLLSKAFAPEALSYSLLYLILTILLYFFLFFSISLFILIGG